MPQFAYQALTETGAKAAGRLEAESLSQAEFILLNRGYIPTRVKEVPADAGSRLSSLGIRFGAVPTRDLILFTKQFRSMLHAGVPIVRLLQVLETQTECKPLRRVITQMVQDIRQGATLFDALEKHPSVFSPLYRSMVRAGEVSGTVSEVLARLIYIIEHEARIRADIKAALQYPVIVLAALVAAFVVLLTFVIPKFVAIFAKSGIALPLPTKIAMILYGIMANYWYLLLGGAVGLAVFLHYFLKTPGGMLAKDRLLLSVPLFGPLFVKAAMSRFASIFAILQASGVPVINAMAILSGTIGNSAVAREFDHVREKIQEGQGIAQPLKTAKYFPPMVIDMVAIGEETGNIEEMMREITNHYDDEVSYAVKALSDAIGPVLMVGLAAVVGFFAMAIFLPMWDLTKMVKT